MTIFKRLHRSKMIADQRGAAVAEYGLIAAVAGVAIAVASLALGSAVTSELVNSAECETSSDC